MKESKRLRILLADDFPQILEEAEKLLRNDCEIIGFARDGGEALQLCLALRPDILLLDISTPVLCGLEVAARLKKSGCRSKIIFLTLHEDRDYVEAAFSLGASAVGVEKVALKKLALPSECCNSSIFLPAR